MYNAFHLFRIVKQAFDDMWPALVTAYNASDDDDRMKEVYGPWPRTTALLLALGCAVLGLIVAQKVVISWPYSEYVSWPAVCAAAGLALVLRRYLFVARGAVVEDFPWLAASLIPPILLVSGFELISGFVSDSFSRGEDYERLGEALVAVTHTLGIAAAMTIGIATLCYRRDWPQALIDLAVRLLVFKIMVWVTTLVFIDIGIVGRLIGGVINVITGWQVPEWLADLSDAISYTALLCSAYLAIIGASWMAGRRSFAELLSSGEVDIVAQIAQLTEPPKSDKASKDSSKATDGKAAEPD